jgi:hypothetical protein
MGKEVMIQGGKRVRKRARQAKRDKRYVGHGERNERN